MKVLVAPDSFKGSMDSNHIIELVEKASKKVFDKCEIVKVPIADGGEGTVAAMVSILNGEIRELQVNNPLYETVFAKYGIINKDTVIIEMAQASGLPLVKEIYRNPLYTTTYGTGELIKNALDEGYKKIIIAIGGSATNDGGIGAMEALGVRFLDENGDVVKGVGKSLINIASVDITNIHSKVKTAEIIVMCDVENPLTGQNGATYVYGAQKGAGEAELRYLEEGMLNYSSVIKKEFNIDLAKIVGAGAAGGLGGALMVFLGAKLQSGIKTILETIDFNKLLQGVDLVVTGEGKLDYQSTCGKVISGIGELCKAKNVPVVAIVGSMGEGSELIYDFGVNSVITTVNGVMELEEAIKDSDKLLLDAAERMFRLIKLGMDINSKFEKN